VAACLDRRFCVGVSFAEFAFAARFRIVATTITGGPTITQLKSLPRVGQRG
jgi:hypothetical protein